MKQQDYHVSITANATPHQAFDAVNSVTKWWTENLEGASHKLDDEFSVQFGDVHYSRQKLIEVIPDKKVVWLVTDSRLNFLNDKKEWNDMKIVFDIVPKGDKTEVHFTQIGLTPAIECYTACSNAWGEYVKKSLLPLINTGKGNPTRKEKGPKT
jgi:Activator of Hsp90 ATPase homolog 1-like protein